MYGLSQMSHLYYLGDLRIPLACLLVINTYKQSAQLNFPFMYNVLRKVYLIGERIQESHRISQRCLCGFILVTSVNHSLPMPIQYFSSFEKCSDYLLYRIVYNRFINKTYILTIRTLLKTLKTVLYKLEMQHAMIPVLFRRIHILFLFYSWSKILNVYSTAGQS